ncbi:MAG: MerR family transcriptional regulator [Flavobacteriales bacterium]|jgi:DNA-binding transcriptional MerR regulator
MSPIDLNSLSKLYYPIGEVARLFSVNASLLRFWEKEFKLEVKKKNPKGNRLYSQEEIKKLHAIYLLVKVQGYTLDGAKQKLKSRKSQSEESSSTESILQKLETIRAKLISFKTS